MKIPNVNDLSSASPRLRIDLNWGTLWSLPDWSAGPRGSWPEMLAAVAAAGYEGVQHTDAGLVKAAGLRASGMGRVFKPEEMLPLAEAHKAAGFDATTLQVGHGLETDSEMLALATALVAAADRCSYPLYLETHRATMTQDMRRTVDLVERVPELRFNADLSHWYTGHEMAYGDFAAKLTFIEPVLDRVRFLHGRIGHAGAIQVSLNGDQHSNHIKHFKQMWSRCFAGFLRTAQSGDIIIFAPELLPYSVIYNDVDHRINYAQVDSGERELSDRWLDAQVMVTLINELFEDSLLI